ncbi:glycosyl hydrolase [Microdochium bolleyi]|uniref:Glycosyl hydrolase n=1 Tax=Microdochium bolleyi TaxID=196109 RepID=A0A136IYF5_9PEZI|nr:glycosyl hydrolase [Microdochium bolleyi]
MKLGILTLLSLATMAVAEQFQNPVIWEDLADNEVIRVNDAFYMTASTMHYSPGAPVLRSYDLVNWEYISHSVPVLDWNNKYNLQPGQPNAYIKGIWASSLRYRPKNGQYYFLACIEFAQTHIYSSPSPTGPWTKTGQIGKCYYDAGLLFDDNDTPYVAYGNTQISVSQLSADLKSEVRSQQVYATPSSIGTLEGSRMYKRNGQYYIILTRPPDAQYVLKASSPWGPYTIKTLCDRVTLAAQPRSGAPHQGSFVDTPSGQWYYMGFSDMYPGGRCPVLAPITWGSDGFPTLTTVNGQWGNYDYPLPRRNVQSSLGTDTFAGSSLNHKWEWNHNPDTAGFSFANPGLTLRTVSRTDDLYASRNTLTTRIRGPVGTGTLRLDFSAMANGDRAGLAALRDKSAYIAVERVNNAFNLVVYTGLTMNTDWTTQSKGSVAARVDNLSARQISLRMVANIRPGQAGTAQFSYSLDGNSFTNIGPTASLHTAWNFFMGYRYGIFNFGTQSTGGSVKVVSFTTA